MKYRKLTENGDYAFGRGGADMHADTPEAVGQAVIGTVYGETTIQEVF